MNDPLVGEEGAETDLVLGTHWHGLPGERRVPGGLAAARPPLPAGRRGLRFGAVSFAGGTRGAASTLLADALEEHLDLDAVLRLVSDGAPTGLRPVRGGLVS